MECTIAARIVEEFDRFVTSSEDNTFMLPIDEKPTVGTGALTSDALMGLLSVLRTCPCMSKLRQGFSAKLRRVSLAQLVLSLDPLSTPGCFSLSQCGECKVVRPGKEEKGILVGPTPAISAEFLAHHYPQFIEAVAYGPVLDCTSGPEGAVISAMRKGFPAVPFATREWMCRVFKYINEDNFLMWLKTSPAILLAYALLTEQTGTTPTENVIELISFIRDVSSAPPEPGVDYYYLMEVCSQLKAVKAFTSEFDVHLNHSDACAQLMMIAGSFILMYAGNRE